ncbi:MAG: uroporphyrinogen-III C-methyltransferase [Bacteroidota bacterium]
MYQITPKLTLVGAGPGDPDLISLKGIKALKVADVVMYDALVSEDLLQYCKPEAELIFVGKRGGHPSVLQDSINFLIVEKAFQKGHVVRLKGGDPFVFGRGQEEIDYAKARGIETAVVPGISSAISAPALANIPVTARGVSDSFWVITGTKSDHSLSEDLKIALQSNATIVLLMAMNKAEAIAEIYINARKGDIPVAVIQNGGTENQKTGIGEIQDLVKIIAENKLQNPAVIVIGEVVKFHETSEKMATCHFEAREI